jgi:hydroxymethylglutaryl-CoA lyase
VIDAVRGSKGAINVSLSTVFGCPMEGNIDDYAVFELMDRFVRRYPAPCPAETVGK